MLIEIEVPKTQEQKEVYTFRTFDTEIVLTGYAIFLKPKGKRKWSRDDWNYWDTYDRRGSNIPEPELLSEVRELAKVKFMEAVTVKTWKEFKS